MHIFVYNRGMENTREISPINTIIEVATYYGCDPYTVRRAIWGNRLAAEKKGGTWLIKAADVLSWEPRPYGKRNGKRDDSALA